MLSILDNKPNNLFKAENFPYFMAGDELEKRVESAEKSSIQAYAEAQEATSENSRIYLDSLKDPKLWIINPTPLLGPVLGFGVCYIMTPINCFLASFFGNQEVLSKFVNFHDNFYRKFNRKIYRGLGVKKYFWRPEFD